MIEMLNAPSVSTSSADTPGKIVEESCYGTRLSVDGRTEITSFVTIFNLTELFGASG
jgi:hypothetical protein